MKIEKRRRKNRVVVDSRAIINGNKSDAPTDIIWPAVPNDTKHRYRFASVASCEKNCSAIGVRILAEGGSAVDSMIATSLCIGVARSISGGIGGGGFMTYYNRSLGKTFVLDYRETAPAAATSTMYENSSITSKVGGGSIAVPGEIAGLWEAHQKFGVLPWSRLFEPAIKMADEGITLNNYLAKSLTKAYPDFNDELKQLFTNPENGEVKKAGDIVKFTKLAETYRRIAKEGVETFYRGSLRDDIIADLQELDGSIITHKDLEDYKVTEKQPLSSTLSHGNYTLTSLPLPSGGVIVQYILNILNGYKFTKDSVSPKKTDIETTSTTYHRIVEAMKFAYATRMDLGDPNYVNVSENTKNMTDPKFAEQTRLKISDDTTHDVEHYGVTTDYRNTTGTAHMSILAGNGDAVAVTTSVNAMWGSKRMGRRTGIIFNNLMDDFSMPGIPSWRDDAWIAPSNSANWIEPGKRPLSAMSPMIVTNSEGEVVLVTGGSGGAQIITATAMTLINNLWFGQNLTEAVSRPRLHHQLLPATIFYEDGFPKEYQDELKKKNHKLSMITFLPVSDSVGKQQDGRIIGVGDWRRIGGADGF